MNLWKIFKEFTNLTVVLFAENFYNSVNYFSFAISKRLEFKLAHDVIREHEGGCE